MTKSKPLTKAQVKAHVARLDKLNEQLQRLTDESQTWNESTSLHVADRLIRRADKLNAKAQGLSAIPEVHAFVLAREAKP